MIDEVSELHKYILEDIDSHKKYVYRSLKKSKLAKNEFVFMLKPELLYRTEYLADIIELMLETFQQFDVSISDYVFFNGIYNLENAVIENQYLQLNQISRYGALFIPEKFLDKPKKQQIIPSYKFLDLYREFFTSEDLQKLSTSSIVEKIGNGIYGLNLKFQEREYFILNPFHPFQMEHFSKIDNRFLVFVCQTNLDYSEITESLCGFFDPERAKDGSIRKKILQSSEYLDLEITTLRNGVHVSPSPLEAALAICRHIPERKFNQTMLGSCLSEENVNSLIFYENLRKNPIIKLEDEKNFIFELCENKNMSENIEILKKVLGEYISCQ